MTTNLKKRTDGFTIIEVLIVLAIAGLILLIVFLAVPALQRNARNTNRRNDVAAVLAGVNEFANNNNGSLPTNVAYANPSLTFTGAAGTTSSQAKVGYFTGGIGNGASQVNIITTNPAVAQAALAGATNDRLVVVELSTCDPAANKVGATLPGAAREFVAQYLIENGSASYAGACQAS